MWWLDRLHVDIVRTRANQVRENDQSDSLSTSTPAFSAPRPVLLGTHCRIESNTRTNLIQGNNLHDTCDLHPRVTDVHCEPMGAVYQCGCTDRCSGILHCRV